ncbi:16S rRNA (guanine(966)-N(2))-methyltransferase RsmD [Persephonella hydrogeniphila]|uniref:16S rRNA (Guanine(966)-N(2))-methyltransferase RsmD n=1 Tax=Persephonella hydrogeniphila TaxID=198703 RepID=A0A285NKW1_9AQUI|nr:RsmD family RNA methyltransferase [Persephonella hydrogeniphila]SNZ10095.1 16S rRNA (guanine(966)-N(2))-methyltransferase RsmD [Persephonella hydrogeniphila]
MNELRPTSSKVRQALFNILYDITGSRFLDLFAGTGEIGITALKKGADFVIFVEKDKKRAEKIKRNASKYSKNFKVVSTDALKFLKSYKGEHFDIIFADPPYNYRYYDKLIDMALKKLREGGVFILEHRTDKSFGAEEERRYGDTVLSFWRK